MIHKSGWEINHSLCIFNSIFNSISISIYIIWYKGQKSEIVPACRKRVLTCWPAHTWALSSIFDWWPCDFPRKINGLRMCVELRELHCNEAICISSEWQKHFWHSHHNITGNVRACKTVNGKKYYGSWSKAKCHSANNSIQNHVW